MKDEIVADGGERLLADPQTQDRIAQVVRAIHDKYQQDLREAGWLKRLLLRWRIRVEIGRGNWRRSPPKVDSI